MSLFDILGPVMVGPSSSHTAGAVRIGYIAYRLMGEKIVNAQLNLYGSFLATARGHGTDLALIAGLLGMKPDDMDIPNSFQIAKKEGLTFSFGAASLRGVHPNTVELELTGESGKTLNMTASSIGGGRIKVCKLDGIEAQFTGDYPTLVVRNIDQPGYVNEVTSVLAKEAINIAKMQIYRDVRGGMAIMVIECDQQVSKQSVNKLEKMEGIEKVTYLSVED